MTPVSYSFDIADGEDQIFQMDRWGYPSYSIQITSGSALVEGTLTKINQNPSVPASWDTMTDQGGTPLTALTDLALVVQSPVDSIRITATGTTVGIITQTGG